MKLRTKSEQKAYLDGFERCAECIKQHLSDKGKNILECQLMAIRNAVESENKEMKNMSDVLTVSFDNGLEDESALCVTRKCGERISVLKMEFGEQADILYHLLTEQMTKAEIKTEK